MGVGLGSSSRITARASVEQIGAIHAGDTLFYDGFESTVLHFAKVDVAGTGTVALETTTVLVGERSLKITTGANANDETLASMSYGFRPIGQSGIVRFSCIIRPASAAADDRTYCGFKFRTGALIKHYIIALTCTAANTATLGYYDAAGTYTTIVSGLTITVNAWYGLEFDVDINNHKILSVKWGNTTYAVGAAGYSEAGTDTYSQVRLGVKTGAAVAKSCFFDEILLRQV